MAAPRRVIEVSFSEKELSDLACVSRSWLNLVEGFFSKLARSVLRHIRVASLPELGQRILAEIDRINRRPVVHTWKWRIAEAK